MGPRTSKTASMDAQVSYDQYIKDKSKDSIDYFKNYKPYAVNNVRKEAIKAVVSK